MGILSLFTNTTSGSDAMDTLNDLLSRTTAAQEKARRILRAAQRPIQNIGDVYGAANVTTTSGSNAVTVNSGKLVAGQAISGPGIPSPAYVGTVSGNTATLVTASGGSTAANATASASVDTAAVIVTPPTSDGAASTITSPVSVNAIASNLFVTPIGAPYTATVDRPQTQTRVGPLQGGGAPSSPPRIGGHGSGYAFVTGSPTVEVRLRSSTYWIVYVTDLRTGIRSRVAQYDQPGLTGATTYNFYRLDFGTAGPRQIEVYSNVAGNYGNVNVLTGYSVRPAVFTTPRVTIIGDSYWEGTMSAQAATWRAMRMATADFFAARLGVINPIVNGIGSTGVIATAGSSNFYNFMQRVQAGDINVATIGAQDMVVLTGSVNDANTSLGGTADDPTLQAAQQAFVAAVMAAQPSALIVGLPQEFSASGAAGASRAAAYKAGFQAAAGGDPRAIWCDASIYMTAPDPGVIGLDSTHPNDVYGTSVIGTSLAETVLASLRAAFEPA